MLTDLSIRDFALVNRLDLEFAPGLLCITGETGAGKSLIVNALAFLLGERAQAESIRTGADSCEVTAAFSVRRRREWNDLAEELGLGPTDQIVLRRDFNSAGRSRVWLNDRPSSVQALKRVGGLLCDLHGQHQHQWLLDPERHREFLDAFIDPAVLLDYELAFEDAQAAREALARAESELAESRKQKEFWEYQLREMDAVNPQPGEYDELTARRDRIRFAAELHELYRIAEGELSSADDSIAPRLQNLAERLRRSSAHDSELADWAARLDEARAIADDVGALLARRLTGDEGDEESLDKLEERLYRLYKLRQKFGGSLERAIEEHAELRERLNRVENSAIVLDDLTKAASITEQKLSEQAQTLHDAREDAAGRLRKALRAPLGELGLGKDPVTVAHGSLPRDLWTLAGPDKVEFLLAANPNEAPKPLSKIASGGELSRVMLALKSVLPGSDKVDTLVFDEIDSGVGGLTASRVADRLSALARGRQVIVITHLHSIAARADVHWSVEKRPSEGRHVPVVRILSAAERVEELGRLIAGGEPTKESRAAARRLVQPQDARGRR
jgi:DNA repair protein RecN (Recombination protein N)